jgi:two-component system phosphate regulon sensor histidine kinase PhoR
LLQGALDHREKAVAFLNTIHQNAGRLSRLVDDLLTLSAIELGEAKLFLETVDTARILEQTLALIAPKASEKGVTIVPDIATTLPPIRADRDRLAQIFLNLLDNAVKFSLPEGKVIVSVASEQGWVAIQIADSGVGIPREEIPRLGERFYRADKARSRELGGTGLGLSIVKHLLQAHGGSMAIESAPGRGTTVSLRFPVFQEPS